MDIRIYAMTHKAFEVPTDEMYIPLQVGAAEHEPLGYLRDNTGENISNKNCYYSELTGHYWVWKNVSDVEYVGTCHYRRYLLNDSEKIFTKAELFEILKEYDVVTTKLEELNFSYKEAFGANHNIKALEATGEVILEKYPDYYETFDKWVNGPKTYYCNMMIMKKTLYDAYCEWLFGIFEEVEKRVDLDTNEDAYHKRVFGFISEFLLTVWIVKNDLHAKECKVGLLGEKVEIKQVKETLAEYFANEDVKGAKEYFLEQKKLRPDLTMEAADITGHLRLSMELIAICEAEQAAGERNVLSNHKTFLEYMGALEKLNQLANHVKEIDDIFARDILDEDIILLQKMMAEASRENAFGIEFSRQACYIALVLAKARKL